MKARENPEESVHHRIEEWLNSATHGLGALLSVIGTIALIVAASQLGDVWKIVSFSIFGASLIMLYLASALYHGARHPRMRALFKTLDHCAIFVLIAGTYTPFTLGILRDSWGIALCSIVWALAVVGVVLKSSNKLFHPQLSNALFLLMGWLIIVAVKPMLESVPTAGLLWLLAGGIAYTVGVAFYAASSRVHYAHFAWHLFVMAGTACHFVAVYGYSAIPAT